MNPTPQQLALFDAFVNGAPDQSVIVVARAGAGKTSSAIEGVRRVRVARPKDDICMVAFNKSIKEEFEARLKAVAPGVPAMTLHGLGYRALMRAWGRVNLNDRRKRDIALRVVPAGTADDTVNDLVNLVAIAMNTLTETADGLTDLMYEYDCAPVADVDPDVYVRWAQKALELNREKSAEISFDQMIYVPAYNRWRTGNHGTLIVDETQDMNACQLVIGQHALAPGGRMFAIGDPRQAIYVFRGASVGSMDAIRVATDATELRLSVTFRCARKIVERVNRIVPDLEAAPGAPEGVIDAVGEAAFLKGVAPGDFVLSRKNAPLARYCLKMLALGRPAFIQGRSIGAGLQTFIRRARKPLVNDLLAWLDRWARVESERLLAAGLPEKVEEVHDKAEAIRAISEGLTETRYLLDRLEKLFADDKGGQRIMFSSVHRAKGLEADRAWLLQPTFREGFDEEEDNLCYVAETRARNHLILVDAPKKGAE